MAKLSVKERMERALVGVDELDCDAVSLDYRKSCEDEWSADYAIVEVSFEPFGDFFDGDAFEERLLEVFTAAFGRSARWFKCMKDIPLGFRGVVLQRHRREVEAYRWPRPEVAS